VTDTAHPAELDSTSAPHPDQLEREQEQLFDELRAVIPGAEVLFAFILTVAFTERFERLSGFQRWTYYCTLLCAAGALLLLLAPASFHRVRFRRHDHDALVRRANTEAILALFLISLSIAGALMLVTDLMFSTPATVAVGVGVWLVTGALWWGIPLERRWRDGR
jgi:Family of unknown function (DUF6328)